MELLRGQTQTEPEVFSVVVAHASYPKGQHPLGQSPGSLDTIGWSPGWFASIPWTGVSHCYCLTGGKEPINHRVTHFYFRSLWLQGQNQILLALVGLCCYDKIPQAGYFTRKRSLGGQEVQDWRVHLVRSSSLHHPMAESRRWEEGEGRESTQGETQLVLSVRAPISFVRVEPMWPDCLLKSYLLRLQWQLNSNTAFGRNKHSIKTPIISTILSQTLMAWMNM